MTDEKINAIKNKCELMLTLEKSDKQFYKDIIELCEEIKLKERLSKNKCKNKHVCSYKGQSVLCYKVKICEYCALWEKV